MAVGLFFIIAGILVAIFPQILVIMISSTLVVAGVGIFAISWRLSRLRRMGAAPSQAMTWWWRW